jgi:hypothetical protein
LLVFCSISSGFWQLTEESLTEEKAGSAGENCIGSYCLLRGPKSQFFKKKRKKYFWNPDKFSNLALGRCFYLFFSRLF